MSTTKRFTSENGAPVVDNTNILTGGSVNPARTIGPAVAAGLYREVPLYVAAHLVGAIFAGGMYRWLWKQPDTLLSVPAPGGIAAE